MKKIIILAAASLLLASCSHTVQTGEKMEHKIEPKKEMDHDMGEKKMDHGSMDMDHSNIPSEEFFVVNMIPHHQEAVDTSRLVIEHGSDQKVKDLAQQIIDAQEREIEMMNGWVDDWYTDADPHSYKLMMGDGTELRGEEMDDWYVRGMIHHHEGAVQMAEGVLKLDPREEVATFAEQVIADQTSEIELMRSWVE